MMAKFTRELRQKLVDEFMARNGGRYDPAGFVAEAASPQHPAHEWFTWDDEKAAADHRLWQARTFVNDLRVRFEVETVSRGSVRVSQVEAPALVSPLATRDRGGGYLPVRPDSPEAMQALCQEGARALAAWLRRYSGALAWAGGSEATMSKQVALLEKAKAPETA